MPKKVIVSYDKGKCTGAGNCASAAPNEFKLEGKRAELIGSQEQDGVQMLSVSGDLEAEKVIEAAHRCPVNAIRVSDAQTGEELVKTEVDTAKTDEVDAAYDDDTEFVIDPAGYFLIRLDGSKKMIEAAFCDDKNEVSFVVRGETPIAIYHTILVKKRLELRPEHCAYLGRELEKAFIALQNSLKYVQDDPLDLSKSASDGNGQQ